MAIQRIKTKKDPDLDEGFAVEFPNGLSVLITRVEVEQNGPTQLSVFVNTEDMDETDHRIVENIANPAYPHQFPEMQIVLNDAIVYDHMPGEDMERGEAKRREENNLALWFTPQCIRDHFEADEDKIAEWVRKASDDELKDVGNWALGDDMIYKEFHTALVACAEAKMKGE